MGTCVGKVWLDSWHHALCGKPGKMEHEGRSYCGRHNPIAKQKRQVDKLASLTRAREESEKCRADAEAMAKRITSALGLGFDDQLKPYYHIPFGNEIGSYRRALVVPLDIMERLLEERS